MTTNQTIIHEGHTYDKLLVNFLAASRIVEGTPDQIATSVNLTFTPYRRDEEGKVIQLISHQWSERYSNVADGADAVALIAFGEIDGSIQKFLNTKNK